MRPGLLYRIGLLTSLLAFACNAPFLGGAPTGGGGGLTSLAPAASLLSPEAYAETARALAAAIAELNRTQELTLEHLRSSPSQEAVDADLLQLGAGAMTVAQLAEQLAASTANQAGGGAAADKAARPYLDAAQVGYFLVIDTQNLREQYKSGSISDGEASQRIAEQGGMLWSADEFDPATNTQPFAEARADPSTAPPVSVLPTDAAGTIQQGMDSTSGKSTAFANWTARAGSTRTVQANVPAPAAPVSDVLDPNAGSQMRTPEGQQDADAVRAAAAARLAALGAVRGGTSGGAGYKVQITVASSTVFQSAFAGRALPYFPDGTASATATADQGGPLVSAVRVQDGQPVVEPPFEVTSDTPLVTLDIKELVPSTTGGDTRGVGVLINWTSTLDNPAFTLVCTTGGGGTYTNQILGPPGELRLALTFSRQRDTAVCQAFLVAGGPPVGASQVIVLEADPTFVPTSAAGGLQPTPVAPPTGEATAEEARPPAGTSNWTIVFGAASVSCANVNVPISSQGVTVTTNEAGDPMTIAGEGGSITMARTGPSTYQGTYEQAVMNLTFTSSRHAEGDYSFSAEDCSITWPVTLDR